MYFLGRVREWTRGNSGLRPPARRVVLFCLGFLLAESGCHKHEEPEEATPIAVRTALAETRTLRPSFTVMGTVLADPKRQATLTAATSGIVDKLVVDEGAHVGPEGLVIQLDERKAKADLEKAKATLAVLVAKPRPEELSQAQALVDKMKAAHVAAQAKLNKSEDLRTSRPELVPEVQLLEDRRNQSAAKAELETAQAQLELLEQGPREEKRREAEADVEAARLQLQFCRVIAPFAGVVSDLKARVGQRADVGTPLATILDTSEVLVQARVPADHLHGVMSALKSESEEPIARIRCEAFPDVAFTSKVGVIGLETETGTGDVPIKLRVENAEHLLRVGMTVRLELFEAEVEDLAIPETALTVNAEGEHIVTLIKDGKASPTEVELTGEGKPEVRAGGWVRIVEGLKAGDAVAIENGYGLPEGTAVKPVGSGQ